jgi:phage terminase large subunit-like protein
VKSNYKNLVGDSVQGVGGHRGADDLMGNQQFQQNSQNANPMIDLEIFNSSQNKTTEQKYEELKLKYDDLLSKHFALAAQTTEDLRDPKT